MSQLKARSAGKDDFAGEKTSSLSARDVIFLRTRPSTVYRHARLCGQTFWQAIYKQSKKKKIWSHEQR